MFSFLRWSLGSAALLALATCAGAVTPIVVSAPASAQDTNPATTPTDDPATTPATPAPADPNVTPATPVPADPNVTPATPAPTAPGAAANFPDVADDYWARPFIQALAERNVITGFPDGTFKPEEPVDRAEFAAMIQKAFNQNPTRQLSPGAFTDVPGDYWAASAIAEAYETGFLSGYPGGLFQPNQEIPKVEAIVALANGLSLNPTSSAPDGLSTYYTDVADIPTYAVDDVVAATQANIVVNYPDVRTLNPRATLTRAQAAALLHQALVQQGQLQPIANNSVAANYIVGGTAATSTTTTEPTAAATPTTPSDQPSPATTSNIVALATANNSFKTLTSALQAAGLTETLQGEGPFTVFAPTDQAFAALPEGTLQQLLQPENQETLTKILRYHMVPGALTASELQSGEVQTVEGNAVNVKVNADANQVTVNNASVIQPNIQASNGVIHAVDEVLLPPDVNLDELSQ